MKRRAIFLVVVSACATLVASPLDIAHASAGEAESREAAVPGLEPPGVEAKVVYLDGSGRKISEPGALPTAVDLGSGPVGYSDAIGCAPESGRDNPHYSSGDVSGHGWWLKGSCTAATATVYNCLYEFYTDNTYRQKACAASRVLRPYTGSGDRTVARATCNPTTGLISWRNHVDVDVDGQIDSAEQPYNQADVNCFVS